MYVYNPPWTSEHETMVANYVSTHMDENPATSAAELLFQMEMAFPFAKVLARVLHYRGES